MVDSYSRWPEVFLTTTPTAEFTKMAFRKSFSREGVPHALVTDNGTHFTAKVVDDWLQGIGCRHLYAPPRHPQSNGLAEKFVRSLKSAVRSASPHTFEQLDRCVDNFLMQYRNAVHASTGKSPSQLFKSRNMRTNMLCLDSANVQYFQGNDFRPSNGIVLAQNGNRLITILDLDDNTVHRRHLDQTRFQTPGESVPISSVEAPTDQTVLDHDESVTDDSGNEIADVRRSQRIQSQPRRDYKNMDRHSTCGGCDMCD